MEDLEGNPDYIITLQRPIAVTSPLQSGRAGAPLVFNDGGTAGFTITTSSSGGTAYTQSIAVSNAATARAALSAALKGAPGVHTITLAKITPGGTNGSITWNTDGVVTAFTDPT